MPPTQSRYQHQNQPSSPPATEVDEDTSMVTPSSPTETLPAREAFDDDRLSPLEKEVLREYQKLKNNLDVSKLSTTLSQLSAQPSSQISDGLRLLERKTALVDTALKSSVYGIVLSQQISEGVGEGEGEGSVLDVGR